MKLADRGMTADWQVYPTTPWNYALSLDASEPARSIGVSESEVGDNVFSIKQAPVRLSIKARKVPAWRAEDGVAEPVPQSPVSSDQPEENVTLLPYAAAKLRISAFPVLNG